MVPSEALDEIGVHVRRLRTFREGGVAGDVGGDDAAGAAAADGAADAGGSDADEDMRPCAQSEYVTPVPP